MNTLTLLVLLYRRAKKSAADTREWLAVARDEAVRIGAFPLGMHRANDGTNVYVWLLFDQTALDAASGAVTEQDRINFLYQRTPMMLRIELKRI